MRRQPVTSTNVSEIGYDEVSRVLEIAFVSGAVYQYFDVPRQVFDALMQAPSVGQYLNNNVKGYYRYARI